MNKQTVCKVASVVGMVVGIKTGFFLDVETLVIVNVLTYEVLKFASRRLKELCE